MKEFPSVWTTMLQKEISSSDDVNVRLKVLNLVQLHHLTSLTEPVEQITMNEKNPATLRLAAIGTIVNDSTDLSNDHFKFLVFQLRPDNSAPTRHLAASVLSRSKLSDDHLKLLARDFVPNADPLILPRILPVFKHGHDLQVGTALTATLLKTPTLDNFTEEYLRDIFKGYPAELNTSVEKLIAKLNEVRAERLNRIHEIEKNITNGDIERGRLVFFGKAICSTCHTIGMEGENFGPDLTSIQRDRSSHDLVEAIVYPSVSFVREYETYKISTAKNNYTGIIEEQNSEFIVLKISPQESVRIPSNDITSIQVHDQSMMPQGLDKMLTDQELADLMAFLVGQDQDPETDSQLLR
jgi:putative heme-binding domain-containing protein